MKSSNQKKTPKTIEVKQTSSEGSPYIRYSVILGIITLIVALILSVVNSITKPIIDKNDEMKQIEAQAKLLPEADSFIKINPTNVIFERDTATINFINEAYTEDKKRIGFIVSVTSHKGYGGDISMMLGITEDTRINKIEILSMSETPGLGSKVQNEGFISQFNQKSGNILLVKSGTPKDNEISAVSAATISSAAVTDAANIALEVVDLVLSASVDSAMIKEEAQNLVEQIKEQTEQEMQSSIEEIADTEETPSTEEIPSERNESQNE